MKASQSLLVMLLAASQPVNAQEAPSIVTQKFNDSVSYRTSVCERQRSLWKNESLTLPNALAGLNLTVAITNYQTGKEKAFFSLVDGMIDEDYPGLFAVILDELALRAGFSWRNSFAVYEPRNSTTDGNKTWTDILEWSIKTFDISMEKWGHSVDRITRGVSFPLGFYDSSVILAEIYRPSRTFRSVNVWSFLAPFESMVWLTIVAAIVVTGLVYFVLEHFNKDTDERQLDAKPLASIFYAAIAFTGHYELKPNTNAARILGFSFTFWALIVASAYTANLASFLVIPRITGYKVSSIEAALAKDAALCVQGGAVIQKILEDKYPDIRLVGKDSEQEIYEALRLDPSEGGCDAAAHQFNSFEIYERSEEVNWDCAISSEKRVIEVLPAGLATAIDTGLFYQCTSLISHVLDYHLTEMQDDGFLEQAWKTHLNKVGTIQCIRDTNPGRGDFLDETFSLTLQDVGGIFIVHAIMAGVAVGIATFQFYQKAKNDAIDDSRTLGTVYGITQAKKKLSSRMPLHSGSLRQSDGQVLDDQKSQVSTGSSARGGERESVEQPSTESNEAHVSDESLRGSDSSAQFDGETCSI